MDFAHEFLILGSFGSFEVGDFTKGLDRSFRKAVATEVPACQSQDLSERRLPVAGEMLKRWRVRESPSNDDYGNPTLDRKVEHLKKLWSVYT